MSTHITCGHCNGTGTCTRGTRFPGEQSCATCLAKIHQSQYARMVAACSICNGTGYVKLEGKSKQRNIITRRFKF